MASRMSPQFVMIQCRCGRTLRAKWDQIGSEIRCWDCQATLPVTVPRDRTRLVARMATSAGLIFRGEGSGQIAIAAIILTASLMTPTVGLFLATVLLTVGGTVYIDTVQTPQDDERYFEVNWSDIRQRLTWTRFGLGLTLSMGTAIPLWVLGLGDHRSPHLGAVGAGWLTACWLVLPVVLLLRVDPPRDGGRVPLRERVALLLTYPLITLGVLLIVPIGMFVCELVLLILFYLSGSFPTFALDYMPRIGDVLMRNGAVYRDGIFYTELPPRQFVGEYLYGVRHGYSFVGAIPPSLSLSSRWGVDPECILWTQEVYGLARAGGVFVICLSLLITFAVQARCLGVLADSRPRGAP